MNASFSAALDQVQAGAREADRIMNALAVAEGTTVQHADVGSKAVRVVLRKLARRAITGDLGHCEHVTLNGTAPVHWSPWAPSRVRCAECHLAAAARIAGTVEDRTCDACQRVGRTIFGDTLQLPAVVARVTADAPPWTIAPVLVHFGLCRSCHVDTLRASGAS